MVEEHWVDRFNKTASLIRQLEEAAAKASQVSLGGAISTVEWGWAQSARPSIVDQWFYEDVGCFIAPGGTGKTTLLLFQAIMIVLGRELFGYQVTNPGPVILLTAEDTPESLVARLRVMCCQLGLSEAEMTTVREEILITDASGQGWKFTKVEKEAVLPSERLDKLVVAIGVLKPSLLIVDPLVSFSIGESRINDAEQGMIEAARRIRNAAKCAVLYVHHTGKQNAREEALDQYAGRGGSALADGARMVHVLQRLTPEKWTEATGNELADEETGFVLARPKMTWCPPQPHVYLKRRGYVFERHDAAGTDGVKTIYAIMDAKVWQFVKDEWERGVKHTQNSICDMRLFPQSDTRKCVGRLLKDNRLAKEDVTGTGRGGAHHCLRPIELPVTT